MSIQVNEFRHIPGKNDAEYIKLLKEALERQKQITSKAIAKIKELSNCSEIPNNWIPCSERLPDEDHWLGGSGRQFSENVLVSVLNSSDEDAWVDVSQTIDGEWVLELPRYCKIFAWMPLPEPYRPKEESE